MFKVQFSKIYETLWTHELNILLGPLSHTRLNKISQGTMKKNPNKEKLPVPFNKRVEAVQNILKYSFYFSIVLK